MKGKKMKKMKKNKRIIDFDNSELIYSLLSHYYY